jgi:hypothetical protein
MTPTQWLIGAGLFAMLVLYVRTLLRMAAQRSEWEQPQPWGDPLMPQRRDLWEKALREEVQHRAAGQDYVTRWWL